MLEFPRSKSILIVLVLALSSLYALPNLYQKDPSVQITANRGAVVDQAFRQRLVQQLNQAHISPKSITLQGRDVLVRLPSLAAQTQANDVIRHSLDSEQYTVALNLASTVPSWLTQLGGKSMVQGLDLVGGVHFTLQVDQKAALDQHVDALSEDMRTTLRDIHIAAQSIQAFPDRHIDILFSPATTANQLTQARQRLSRDQPTLDFTSDDRRLVVRLPERELTQVATLAVEQNITTLRHRVNELGVAEPIIQRQGQDRIVVQLPGIQDTAEAKRLIGATTALEFRGVYDGDAAEAVRTGNVPPEARVYSVRGTDRPILLNKRVIASGDQMTNATVGADDNGLPAVNVTLNASAGQRMFDYTQTHLGKLMSVVYIERVPTVTVIDGKEVRGVRVKADALPPTVIAAVFGSKFRTTGLDKAEADNLAKLLRAGSLAAPMDFIEEQVIGPSLGAENVARGVTAVIYAFLFTLAFFALYYRMFGVITALALLMNLIIVVAVLSLFGATMTLPGFAGLALSIGLSVDANVLINERIREELRAKVPVKMAIATGYDKAGGTILDANLTGMIAGVALYAFGTGPLKGFAVTLIVGILASMFTAITVSRALAVLCYGRRKKLTSLAI